MSEQQQQDVQSPPQPPWTGQGKSESPEWGSTRATAEELCETMTKKLKYALEWAE